ncbi:MAG: twin-arginine translocase TatA/TatE family subunit [Bacteroidales bacterium]|jgi:sec-independent protein translocase protein TatA|nr:twin-arginine translocase TatA/TatE family subunit [Bacteroidales bacterium]MEE3406958.1 twin-arginine translocase TatA/TatE family subunit [Candidatus Cryptobacteroides sp.]SKC40655.1 sec-independent protein translocase protein TatA [Bacteroidales bacterium WCE2008]MBO7366095.1 twin-arginine translocase TatA/TatE family subunit [Bacteroidales bacterium]MBQ1857558.1 twin-arginine translocase TatA/TatE family subunit [Bacteroidales bacterium]
MIAYPLFIGYGEIILIVILFLLLFGAKKIPELMRGLGKGVKSFKEGLNDVEKEIKKEDNPSEKEDK